MDPYLSAHTMTPMTEPQPITPPTTPPAATDKPAADKPAGKADRGIPSLDGIRAVSIAIVLASHAYTGMIPGAFGVTVFFFLSGYLITTLLRLEYQKTGTISLKKFYVRRALRIFPNAYVVLLVISVLAALGLIRIFPFGQDHLDSTALWFQALYLNNYHSIFYKDYGTAHGLGVYWSLAIEEHFYMVFPAMYLLMHRFLHSARARVMVMLALCAMALAWRMVIVHFDLFGHYDQFFKDYSVSHSYAYRATDARLDAIMYGCILAVLGNPYLDKPWLSDRFWMWVACPIATVVLVLTFLSTNHFFDYTLRFTIQSVCLFPFFIAAVRCHRHPVFSWLNWGWIKFIGVLSYSLYLVHLVLIFNFNEWVGKDTATLKFVGGTLAILCSFVIAVIMHYGLERPLEGLRRKMR
jgi:peptidoglycan/LPS O-acetylase OafA/YrhL